MRGRHPKLSMSFNKSRLYASLMCPSKWEQSWTFPFYNALLQHHDSNLPETRKLVFTGKTKNTLWPVLLQFSFILQSLNYRFLLKKYGGKARVLELLCCDDKILTKTLPPFVWVKAIKKIKSKLLDYNVTIKMNKVIYRMFCENTYFI